MASVPIQVQAALADKVLSTPLEEYFVVERLTAHGMALPGAQKLCNALFHRTSYQTVGDLVKSIDNWNPAHFSQTQVKVLGLKGLEVFKAMLREDGVETP